MAQHWSTDVDRPRQWLGYSGLILVAVVLTGASGFRGLVLSIIVSLLWWRFRPEYAFAFGQFALVDGGTTMTATNLVSGAHSSLGLLGFGLGEAGLVMALLIAPRVTAQSVGRRTTLGLAAAITTVMVLSGISIQYGDALWVSTGALVGASAIVMYSLHRYERWQVELRAPANDGGTTRDA